jgi:magnesium-transporting ATPase (P-type)
MKHRKEQNSRKVSIFNWISLIQFFVGIIFSVLFYRYYWKTLIDSWTAVAFVATIGFLFALMTLNFYKRALKDDFNLKDHFVVSIIFYGFTITSILLSINFHITQKNLKDVKATVHDSYHKRYGGLYIKTSIDGFDKTLIFNLEDLNGNSNPELISVTIDKGYFGYTVVKNRSVLK